MAEVNVFAPQWDSEMSDVGRRAMRLGPKIGSVELGVSLFEIDPGGAVSPIHIHHGNEELLLVLSGRVQVRAPDGTQELDPGAVVAFPRGPAGAHQIANKSEEPARLLVFSTMNVPEVTELLTTGTMFVSADHGVRRTFPPDSAQEFMALWRAAFEADRG
ncbi:MAG: cupin domain-containing protein [Solirubrobacteraceae bacterium]